MPALKLPRKLPRKSRLVPPLGMCWTSGTLLVSMTDAAFNFKADITDAQAEQIYKGLLNKKLFKENEGRIEW